MVIALRVVGMVLSALLLMPTNAYAGDDYNQNGISDSQEDWNTTVDKQKRVAWAKQQKVNVKQGLPETPYPETVPELQDESAMPGWLDPCWQTQTCSGARPAVPRADPDPPITFRRWYGLPRRSPLV